MNVNPLGGKQALSTILYVQNEEAGIWLTNQAKGCFSNFPDILKFILRQLGDRSSVSNLFGCASNNVSTHQLSFHSVKPFRGSEAAGEDSETRLRPTVFAKRGHGGSVSLRRFLPSNARRSGSS